MNVKRKDLIKSIDVLTGEPELYENQLIVARIEIGARPEYMQLDGYLSENFEVIVTGDTEALLLLKAGIDFAPKYANTLYFGFLSRIGNNTDTEQFRVPVEMFSDFVWQEPAEATADTLTGDARADYFDAGDGDDVMYGGNGDDFFVGGDGADAHYGGDEIDTIDYRYSSSAVNVNLAANVGTGGAAQGDTWFNVERVFGSFYHDDVIRGTANDDRIYGYGGNDSIFGDAGQDYLDGGAGADSIDGGADRDTLQYTDSDAGVIVDLAAGTGVGGHADGDTIANVEVLHGSHHDDVLSGDAVDNVLRGDLGDDSLNGRDGDDYLVGGVGADALNGGDGIDTAGYSASDVAVTVDLATGTGTGGDAQGDTLTDIERLHGSSHDDTLLGSGGNEIFAGRSGDDSVDGREGDDLIYGESGNDSLLGGEGADRVYGGLGNDLVQGGVGNDILQGDNPEIRGPISILAEGTTNNRTYDGVAQEFETADGQALYLDFETAFARDGFASLNSGEYRIYFNDELVHTVTPTSFDFKTVRLELVGTGGLDKLEVIEEAGFTLGRTKLLRNVTISDIDTGMAIAADDTLLGGEGNDTLYGDMGNDILNGGEGFDAAGYHNSFEGVTVNLSTGTADGGFATGDTLIDIEKLYGSKFADTLTGDEERNILKGGAGDDTLSGAGGYDVLYGEDGNDVLYGGDGGDYFYGGAGDDTAYGGADCDKFIADEGADHYDGGDDLDIVNYTGAGASVTVNLATGKGSGDLAEGDTYANIERVFGSDYDDTLISGAGDDRLYGNGGVDLLEGGDGNDYLDGGDNDDFVNGGAGSDALRGGAGDDVLNGGDGDDTIFGGEGADNINGGAGFDAMDYRNAASGVSLNTATGGSGGAAWGDLYTNIERFYGSIYADTMTGGEGTDRLNGEAGNDVLNGGGGTDYLAGGAGIDALSGDNGNDFLYGEDGNDNIDGGQGSDRLYGGDGDDIILGGGGGDTLFGDAGADRLDGGWGFDVVDYRASGAGVTLDVTTGGTVGDAAGDTYANIERFHGSAHADNLMGGSGTDRLNGAGGDDIVAGGDSRDFLAGGTGNDTLVGDGGDDFLYGEDGDDRLVGGAGNDQLFGGAGVDSFIFTDDTGTDIVTDFEDGVDLLDFTSVSGVANFGDLSLVDTSNGVEVGFMGNKALIQGITVADLDHIDFLF